MSLRPLALNDLPMPSQVRINAPGYSRTVQTVNGRAGFPDVPTTVTVCNLFIEFPGRPDVPVPGYKWYGVVTQMPANPVNDWWATEIPAAYPRPLSPNWYQLPDLLQRDVPPIPPMPPIPTREQVCGGVMHLAGLTYQTKQWGAIPAWFYGKLNAEDRASARSTHRQVSDTHIHIGISEAYIEPSTLWPYELSLGYDYAYEGLETFRAIVEETIRAGFLIDLPLAGDGLSVNDHPQQGQYNDPQGNTYGWQWLMLNFARIVTVLQGDGTPQRPDLTPYIAFRPGWDAVFYGWGRPGEVPDQQPARVDAFGQLFRHLLPNGYLRIEHTPGNIPCGEGGRDFAPGGLMQNYDGVMSEFNTVHEDSCWQVVGRMVQPYTRPPDQPAGDDPLPPFYLAPGTPRGPYFYCGFEPAVDGVYEWARGHCSAADTDRPRTALRNMGVRYTG